jgi:uncharacterized RDD family membrane protein YckC
MSEPPLGPPPPPEGPSGYPPPPAGWLPPPPAGAYQQQGYGYTPGQRPQYAGFWIRFGSLLIDSVLVGVVSQVATSIGFAVSSGLGVLMWIASFAAGVAYYASLEGGATGQTLGKRVCNIRVVDADTLQPGVGVGRGIGRYFARWLSGIAIGLGYFWMLWDDRNQTWHDKLTNVVVVRTNQ